jgi:RNA polymerase sigma-70 factor (ECF subfamily)
MSEAFLKSGAEPHAAISAPSSRMTLPVDESDSALSIHDAKETDEELVTRANLGDQTAFAELCRRYGRVLRQRIYRIVRNYHDAEDITQESLMKAYTHLAGFRRQCSFQTWLTRIAVNSSLMHLRKRTLRSHASIDLPTTEGERFRSREIPDPSPNPEQDYDAHQTRLMLTRAVQKLPPNFRQVLEHYHQDETNLIDVANAVGITVAAAKSRLLRARKLLRRRLNSV